jgi:osmoprotectant transport system substrate-binding protein
MVATAAVACGAVSTPGGGAVTADDRITVASFDFAESVLLAEVYAQALERAGFDVARAPVTGPREVVLPALETGLLEVIPEYEGSATAFLGGTPVADPAQAHAEMAASLEGRGLVAASPAPAQDRNAFVVPAAVAERYALRRLSDLTAVDQDLTLGGPPECPQRDLCLLGLQETYGLSFAGFVPLDAGGPLTERALAEGAIDIAVMFTTSPGLDPARHVILADDLGLQPSERVVPLVHAAVIDRFGPGVLASLDSASAGLTTAVLRAMNGSVAAGQTPAAVAAAYLDGRFGPGAG